MKTRLLIYSVLCIILTGCCEYDENDVQFTSQESDLIRIYNLGDTLTFVNSIDSIQEWIVLEIDTTLKTGCFMEGTDHNIYITLSNIQNELNTPGENSFSISKYPGGQIGLMTSLSVFFEDFSGDLNSENNLKSIPFSTLKLRNILIPNIVEIESRYMERKSLPKDITNIYWSKTFGLAAFKTLNEEVWIEKRWL